MRDDTSPAIPSREPQTQAPSVSTAGHPAPHQLPTSALSIIFSSIRSKIILPYLFLTILVAMLGTFIVTRLIAGTLEERFTNQLLEASRVAGDGIVRREEANLESLRLMVFTVGVNDAIVANDAPALREMLEPLAANANLNGVLVVNAHGQEVLGLHAVSTPAGGREYQLTQGQDLSRWPLVVPVLAGELDAYGDKYAGLVNTPAGMFMYTSGPVVSDEGEIVGAILVGVSLDRVLAELKLESLADVTFFGPDGLPIASSFPGWQTPNERAALQISPVFFQEALSAPENRTPLAELELFERDFRVAYVPLRIRRATLGVLSVALPSNFIYQAASTSRTTFALLFSLAALLAVLVGFLVAQRIVRPVLRLVQVSRAIAAGDLSQRVGISPSDELGTLAQSFDSMTDNLQHSTLALQEEVAKVSAILTSIADGVVVRDNEGEVVLMNTAARAMLGRTSDIEQSLLALPLEEVVDGDEATAIQTYRIQLADRVVSARTAPVLTDNGNIVGNVLVMRDVTREAAAERLKDDFVNHISHELRTPLTVIKGYSDILRPGKKRVQTAAYEKAATAIFAHAASLERMISQLIDLSEMAAGTLQLDLRRINLNQFTQQTLADWDETLRQAGLKAQVHAEMESLTIDADVRRLRWAFDAILENACQYCPRGGHLDITLSRAEMAAVVQISDQGVGISGEDLPHVFDRFYRGKPIDADGNLLDLRGMGQGLYVVKSVIETHGGRVWAESEVGKGSVFSLLLPLIEDTP